MKVYLVEANGRFKIGRSGNLDERIKALQSGNPERLSLVHSFSCSQCDDAEKSLHRLFKSKCLVGEWFSLTESDVNFLRTIVGFENGSFIYSNMPIGIYGEATRPTLIFEFKDFEGETFSITESEIYSFLQVCYARPSHQFSRRYWLRQRRPPLSRAKYEALMKLLIDNNLINGRRGGASGWLTATPRMAMAVITDRARAINSTYRFY